MSKISALHDIPTRIHYNKVNNHTRFLEMEETNKNNQGGRSWTYRPRQYMALMGYGF